MPSRRRSSSVIGGRRRQSRRVSRVNRGRRYQSTHSRHKYNRGVIPYCRRKHSIKQYGGMPSTLSIPSIPSMSSMFTATAARFSSPKTSQATGNTSQATGNTSQATGNKRTDDTVYHCMYGQSCKHPKTQGFNKKLADLLLTFIKEPNHYLHTNVIILLGPTDEKLEMRNALLGNAGPTASKESYSDIIVECEGHHSPICIYYMTLPKKYNNARIEIVELCSDVSTRPGSAEKQHRGSVNTFENIIELIKIAEYLDLDFNTLHHWSGVGILQTMRAAIPFYETDKTTLEEFVKDLMPFFVQQGGTDQAPSKSTHITLPKDIEGILTDQADNNRHKVTNVSVSRCVPELYKWTTDTDEHAKLVSLEQNEQIKALKLSFNNKLDEFIAKYKKRLQSLCTKPINKDIMQEIYVGDSTDPGMLFSQKNAFQRFCEYVKERLFTGSPNIEMFHSFDTNSPEYKVKFDIEVHVLTKYLAGFNNGDIIKSYANFMQMTNKQRGTFPMSERTY